MTALRHIGILVLIYLGVVAQSSLVPEQLAGMGRPFLPAILLVLIAAWCEATPAILWSGVLGFVLDGLSTERLGVQLALAAMLALGMQLLRSMWSSRNRVSLLAMVLVTGFAWRTLAPMTHAVLTGHVVDPHVVLIDAARDTAATTAIAGVLILLGRGLTGRGFLNRTAITSSTPRWGTVAR